MTFLFVREVDAEDSLIGQMRRAFGGPVIANDEMTSDDGRRLIEGGAADAATFYPDSGEDLAVGYTDYPALVQQPA